MSTRTSDDTVTFLHPFRLSGVDELQPAGRYVVETDEEPLPTVSLPAYRRLSTFIHLAGRPDSNELARVVDVDPAELAAALARDAAVQDAAPAPIVRPAAGRQESKRGAKHFVIEGWKRWVTLNATELTWTIVIVGGVALAGVFTWSAGGTPSSSEAADLVGGSK
jgi:hypothetical protein